MLLPFNQPNNQDMTNAPKSSIAQDILNAKDPGAGRFQPGRYYMLINRNGVVASTRKEKERTHRFFRIEGTNLQTLETAEQNNNSMVPGTRSHGLGEEVSMAIEVAPDPDGYGRTEVKDVLQKVTCLEGEALSPMMDDLVDIEKSALSPSVVEVHAFHIPDKTDKTKPRMQKGNASKAFVKVRVIRALSADEIRKIPGWDKFLSEEQVAAL